MYNFNDKQDIKKFKERLQQARKSMNLRQETFAEALHYGRSSIGNWESTKKDILPTLENFVAACNVLHVEPNYLLGVSDFPSEKIHAISEATGLSENSVQTLCDNKDISNFIDHILTSSDLDAVLHRIKQVYYYGMIAEAQKTTFSAVALKKIKRAFDRFYREVFPLDMNVARFADYIKQELKWHPDKVSINDYIHSIITDNEYNNILFDFPDFEKKTDSEKYDLLIHDIASTSYEYMMGQPIIELAQQEIANALSSIIKEYINTLISSQRTYYQNLGGQP